MLQLLRDDESTAAPTASIAFQLAERQPSGPLRLQSASRANGCLVAHLDGIHIFGKLWPLGLLLLAGGAGLLFVAHKIRARSVPILAPDGESEVAGQDQTHSKRSRKETRAAVEASTPAQSAEVPVAAKPEERPDRWSQAVFDMIEWRRFEAVVEALFKQAGFETKSQSHGADGGVDIWLYSRNQPGAPVSLVQCKHWQGKKVSVDKIRELRGVMAAQNVKRGQFATTSTFTADAMAFAAENGVNLLSVDKLLQLIASRTPKQQADLLNVALEGEYWRPTCVNCGVKMVDRVPRNGGAPFWGCPAFPKCKTTMPMRAA